MQKISQVPTHQRHLLCSLEFPKVNNSILLISIWLTQTMRKMNGSYVNDFKAWDFFYKLFFDSCTENSVIQILGHDTYKSSTYIFAEFSSHFLLIRLPNGLWSFIIFLSKHFFWQQTKSLYKSHVATQDSLLGWYIVVQELL